MSDPALAKRMDTLESYMKDLSYQALRTERELACLSAEMREFKNEMREFKNEMRQFKKQSEIDRRAMNRKWGELANKMGTMVEDLVAPNLPRIAHELFGCEEPECFAVRARRRSGAKTLELDALVVCKNVVMINETKNSLQTRDIDDISEKLKVFADFFPEWRGPRVVGILASLYADDSLVRYATSQGILVMTMGDETMQVINPEATA